MKELIVIGVTGQPGSGKDAFAQALKKHFEAAGKTVDVISSGDLVRKYASSIGIDHEGDRTALKKAAEDMRAKHGPQVWIERALDMAEGHEEVLIYTGLRHVDEGQIVHQHGGKVIAVEVPQEIRYQRVLDRNRPGDDISFEKFVAQEKAETSSVTHQVGKVIEMADIKVENSGTLEDLETKAEVVAQSLLGG